MNDLHVNDQLAAAIVDDQNTNTAPAITERTLNTAEQAILVNNRQALLHIASLSHGHNQTIVTNVQNAVLLENGAEHGLDNHRWSRIADERGLFMQLAGEEVDTKVAILPSLGRHGDANDLRGTALEKENVTGADEVALNWHTAAAEPGLNVADLLNSTITDARRATGLSNLGDVHLVPATFMVVMVVVAATGEWVQDAVGSSLHAAAEAVVLALVVVVTHVSFDRLVDFDLFLLDSDFGLGWTTTLVLDVVGGIGSSTVVALGDV